MPLQSANVFASHIGHTGKTTMCFQMSCFYAKKHPELSIMVMDLTEEGDLTKRFLGGVDAAAGKVEEIFGGVFKLFSEAGTQRSGMTSWLFGGGELDIAKHAIQISQHNANIPTNLYLVSSGAYPREEPAIDSDTRKRIAAKIRSALDNSPKDWKLFCDTDGDRHPSAFTKIAYNLCSGAIIPLHLNKADLDRTETMLGYMWQMREKGEIQTQIVFVVWNLVKVLKDEPTEHNGKQLPFTPTKVALDQLDACNQRLYKISQELPGLFVHGTEDEVSFMNSSTTVLRMLADNVLKPSEELGMPFIQMVDSLDASGKKSMKFTSGGVTYDTKDSVIYGTAGAVDEIAAKFEAMAL